MAYDFTNRISRESIHRAMLKSMGVQLTDEELQRLNKYAENWNFYEGYHWEGIEDDETIRVTENYIRKFVDTFTAFETGGGFTVHMTPEAEKMEGEVTPLDFIQDVWKFNNMMEKLVEIGQSKSITGDAWVQVSHEPAYIEVKKGVRVPNPKFDDPFGEFPGGRIRINVLPSSVCFPEYSEDQQRRDHVEKFVLMYPLEREDVPGMEKLQEETSGPGFFSRKRQREALQRVMYRQTWTRDSVTVQYGDDEPVTYANPYGVIPFRQIKNFPIIGKDFGVSDVDDIIPLNVELNLKKSNISEIIDYHSAPVTVLFGARVSHLERGANKLWGGLPKDSRVENLRLDGDLLAAQSYIEGLKTAMSEIGNIPKGVLGGDMGISNTSAPALHMYLLPLLERVKVKQELLREGLVWINKLILLIGEREGMITPVEGMRDKDRWKFFYNEVEFGDILPKDKLVELQQIEIEMRLGIAERKEALQRLGKTNIEERIKNIDADIQANPKLYGQEDIQEKLTLMKEQRDMTAKDIPGDAPGRKVGENKDGKPKQVNAGLTNSREPKIDTSKPTPRS